MSNVIYSAWLVRQGSLGWEHVEVKFGERPVMATIQLSSFGMQESERFAAFQRRYAYAYLETINTPKIVIGGWSLPNPDKLRDNSAWLTTDHLTFVLQADNVEASAVGIVHDMSSAPLKANKMRSMDFAIYDPDGTVRGKHHAVQLYGGTELDAEEIQDRALTWAKANVEDTLHITLINPQDVPSGTAFRIDPRTQRPLLMGE